jgi:hypothetical protein
VRKIVYYVRVSITEGSTLYTLDEKPKFTKSKLRFRVYRIKEYLNITTSFQIRKVSRIT